MHLFLLIRRWSNRLIMPGRKTPTQKNSAPYGMLRLFLIVYIHDAFLKFQDDNAPVRPPTPPHSSPLRKEGRSFSSSTAPQWCNSSPTAQRRRSRSRPIPKNSTGASPWCHHLLVSLSRLRSIRTSKMPWPLLQPLVTKHLHLRRWPRQHRIKVGKAWVLPLRSGERRIGKGPFKRF